MYLYYTDVEPDFSIAEIYEVELMLKLPLTALCLGGTAIAIRPLFRRASADTEESDESS